MWSAEASPVRARRSLPSARSVTMFPSSTSATMRPGLAATALARASGVGEFRAAGGSAAASDGVAIATSVVRSARRDHLHPRIHAHSDQHTHGREGNDTENCPFHHWLLHDPPLTLTQLPQVYENRVNCAVGQRPIVQGLLKRDASGVGESPVAGTVHRVIGAQRAAHVEREFGRLLSYPPGEVGNPRQAGHD